MKCERCKHPLSAHYPDGRFKSMWGGVCESACRMFVPKKKIIEPGDMHGNGDKYRLPA